MTKVTIPYFLH